MPADRYFLNAPFVEGSLNALTGAEAFHFFKVMRGQKGDLLELVNGKGQLASCVADSVSKESVSVIIQSVIQEKPKVPVIICQALAKPAHLDWIVEKGTELGMTALWLFPGERSEKKGLSETQIKRFEHLSIAALKQCGRLDLPEIVLKPPLKNWSPPALPGFFGDLSDGAKSFSNYLPQKDGLCFFVGPESGFSSHEIAHLKKIGAKGVRLHPHILRTETAPLVALSLYFGKDQ